MAIKSSGGDQRVMFMIACLVLGFICSVEGQHLKTGRHLAGEAVFDVSKYGAKGDGNSDNSQAFIKAWDAACKSSAPSRLLVPKGGNFMTAEVVFEGPCKSPITFDIQGTLLASSDIKKYDQTAWFLIDRVDNLVITGGGTIDGRGASVWHHSTHSNVGARLPISVKLIDVTYAKVFNVKFLNGMGVHLKVTDCKKIDIYKISITAPHDSPNTDGVVVTSSSDVKVLDSVIGTGDDCVAVGHTSENVLVSGITCGPGHGLSIGSLGKRPDELSLKGVMFKNCTCIGSTNGARIKTYHGSPKMEASNITFDNIVMKGVANPILINQHYDSVHTKQQSTVKLSDIRFMNIKGTSITPESINLNCSSSVPCQVELSNINLTPFNATIGAITSVCSSAKITPKGQIIPAVPARCS